MIIPINLQENSYDIIVERGAINRVEEYLNLNRKVLIVTDEGVPKEYSQIVASKCKYAVIKTVKQGETSKSLPVFEEILTVLLKEGFTRKDLVVAVGGGVVGDLSGFVAASYMRGIDFYNIPTTALSQIDSSIGGKTGINLNGIKNIVGAFYQPKKVIVDPNLLKTLDKRLLSEGLVEALKMSLTSNDKLFSIFENEDIEKNIDTIIIESLKIKRYVVEQDEKEAGLRKILNFGHTLGHAIEAQEKTLDIYHGECVALGMIPFLSDNLKPRVINVLKKLGISHKIDFDINLAKEALKHDKKSESSFITIIKVNSCGSFITENMDVNILQEKLYEILK